jgi:hypothetical protein
MSKVQPGGDSRLSTDLNGLRSSHYALLAQKEEEDASVQDFAA